MALPVERNDGQELQQGEGVKPKNYVFITNYEEWKREQKACQQERKVTVLEITNLESCGVMRPLFVRLVEEFRDVRFMKVLTGTETGLSTDMVCVPFIFLVIPPWNILHVLIVYVELTATLDTRLY